MKTKRKTKSASGAPRSIASLKFELSAAGRKAGAARTRYKHAKAARREFLALRKALAKAERKAAKAAKKSHRKKTSTQAAPPSAGRKKIAPARRGARRVPSSAQSVPPRLEGSIQSTTDAPGAREAGRA